MAKKSTKKPHWTEWEGLYQQSGDSKYLALAIGRQPDNPPQWAIDECQYFYEELRVSRRGARGPRSSSKDRKCLQEMAKLIYTSQRGIDEESWREKIETKKKMKKGKKKKIMTPYAAAKRILPSDGERDANLRRLLRLWKQEDNRQQFAKGDPRADAEFHPRVLKLMEEEMIRERKRLGVRRDLFANGRLTK
jgi:hypothetical protein